MRKPLPFPTEVDLGPLPNHTKMADLQLMADQMRMLKGADAAFFAYELVVKDLMRAKEEDTIAAIEMAKDAGVLEQALAAMFSTLPDTALELIEAAIKHMLEGKDETDATSVGGWNKDELETAYASLYVARGGLTIPFGSNVQ